MASIEPITRLSSTKGWVFFMFLIVSDKKDTDFRSRNPRVEVELSFHCCYVLSHNLDTWKNFFPCEPKPAEFTS